MDAALKQQPDDLARGAERARREHADRDQRAHRQRALGDQVHADDDDRDRGHLADPRRASRSRISAGQGLFSSLLTRLGWAR